MWTGIATAEAILADREKARLVAEGRLLVALDKLTVYRLAFDREISQDRFWGVPSANSVDTVRDCVCPRCQMGPRWWLAQLL